MKKISVIGTGYAGLSTAVGFAARGHIVVCIDIEEEKVSKINSGVSPVYETGLEDSLRQSVKEKRLTASLDVSAIKGTDMTFVAVGTPSKKDGSIDLSQIENASRSVAEALSGKNEYHVVAIKSTVLPGTTERVLVPAIEKFKEVGKEVGIAMNPEFLREGRALEDFLNPDRVVIGEYDSRSGDGLEEIYKNFGSPILRVPLKTAEMIKYASNALLATKISFANEIGNVCKSLGIDTYDVMKGVGMDKRIGPHFLAAGSGFGGSCFPKDVSALASKARELGIEPRIMESVLGTNERQKTRVVDLLENRSGPLLKKQVAVLGLSFKPGTDDVRDSVAVAVIGRLLEKGASVRAYDPVAMNNMKKIHPGVDYCKTPSDALEGADACLVLTDWEEFSRLADVDFSRMRSKIILEGRRVLDSKKVSGFEGVCW